MKHLKTAKPKTMQESKQLYQTVADIIDQVRQNGDAAVIDYNTKFDQNTRTDLRVSEAEIEQAYKLVDQQTVDDLKFAAENIRNFAKRQKASLVDLPEAEIYPGVLLGHRAIPLESCCCYVPGGGYPLPSSALMLAIPAAVAGVKRIAACAPAVRGTNSIHPATLVAMDIAGVHEIYTVGGAHAVAAFAYGTTQIQPVDIIVGPGNQYVTEAKRQCYGQTGIDFVAGPSEVLVIADETANPEIIAADLLAQSEHDLLARGILLCTNEKIALEVIEQVEKQLLVLETAEKARISWENNGEVILVDSLKDACMLSNEFAPEHLEIQIKHDSAVIPLLTNYGSLFIGAQAAEVFGDYVSGTNHTLPTLRAARYTGGVWVGTFIKVCTNQRMTKQGVEVLAPIANRIGKLEGLHGHANSAAVRLKYL